MRRMCLAVVFIAAAISTGCGEESDEEQIRQVIQESADDEVNAHDRDALEWCDTRVVVGGMSAWRDLLRRLDSGMRGPSEEMELSAAASEDQCVSWVERYTEQLRKLDEDLLKESHGGVEITEVRIRDDVARADGYQGEYEEPHTRDWVLVELTEGDWRVLGSGEVAFLTPVTD